MADIAEIGDCAQHQVLNTVGYAGVSDVSALPALHLHVEFAFGREHRRYTIYPVRPRKPLGQARHIVQIGVPYFNTAFPDRVCSRPVHVSG